MYHVALGVGLGRLGLAQQFAEVEEVLLAGAALGEAGLPPLGDELLGGHGAGRERRKHLSLGKQTPIIITSAGKAAAAVSFLGGFSTNRRLSPPIMGHWGGLGGMPSGQNPMSSLERDANWAGHSVESRLQ